MLKSKSETINPQVESTPGAARESWLDRPLLAAANLNWEKTLYGLLIALAVLSRLWDLGYRVMSHDETVHVQWSWYLFRGDGYSHTPLSHGPFLFHVTALSYYLFGDNDVSARLAVALLGILLVALPYTMRHWLGRTGALVASFLFLISPSLLYYSRYIRHDIPIIVWALIAIWAIFRYLEGEEGAADTEERRVRRTRHKDIHVDRHAPIDDRLFPPGSRNALIVLAAAISLMFATKEVAYIYIAIFGLFLVLLFFVRMGAPRWKNADLEKFSQIVFWIMVGALLLSILSFGLSRIVDDTTHKPEEVKTEIEAAIPDEPPEKGLITADTLSSISDLSLWIATLLFAVYVALLALDSPSHQGIVLTILGLIAVIALAMTVLLFSLSIIDLFPARLQDCGQAPVTNPVTEEQYCPDSGCEIIKGSCQRPDPSPIALTRGDTTIAAVFIVVIAFLASLGAYLILDRLMPFQSGERPAFDMIVFIGSFALPFASALFINGVPKVVSKLVFGYVTSFNSLDYSDPGLVRSLGFVMITLAVSVGVGLRWDWRRWLPAAGVFFVIFVVLFSTVFTNGQGLASGVVGSLGYWLDQQAVERGSQPDYYYTLIVPLYEYLPLFGFLAAALYVLIHGPRPSDEKASPSSPPIARSARSTFVLFILFWTPMTWLAYSYAGEKMPWLTTHFAIPMALATAWIVGRLIEGANPMNVFGYWRKILRRGGWAAILIAPVLLAALVQTVSPWLGKPGTIKPFSGHGLNELNATMQFIAAFLILLISLGALYWVWERIGLAAIGRILAMLTVALFALLTVRTAWTFAYINQDYASEYMVYAHSTPDVREVMEQIEDISRRTAGELELDIGYTADGSYPFIWYLRNYPNAQQLPDPPNRNSLDKSVIVAGDGEWSGIEPYVGDNYFCNKYSYLWWPAEEYKNLTWERIRYAITNSEMRAALWDIIFKRDYRKYERATGKTINLAQWPLRSGFRFCIRRDVATTVWSENAGPFASVTEAGEIGAPPQTGPQERPDYTGLERPIAAEQVIHDLGVYGDLNAPHGTALDAEGFLYVADSNNHRIVKFSPEGYVVDVWDSAWLQSATNWQPGCVDEAGQKLSLADAEFCEPWGVAVGPDGNIYVADTWNHRIQVFTPDGQFLNKVGDFGQSGNAVASMPSLFYGPRDVVVDARGWVYVSDTGNKRIQVFDADLEHQFSFGGPGIIEGRLDEPVGLAIGPNDLLYVADTWNLRMQVFTLDGESVDQWPIAGWAGQSTLNKPYVDIDSAGNVYVSDPETPHVIIFNDAGSPLAVLGGPSSNAFRLPTGVALDAQNRLWVSDATNNNLLRFASLNLGAPE